MVRKGNLAIFESSNISKIKKATPIKTGVHTFHTPPTCVNVLRRFCLPEMVAIFLVV